MTKKSSTRYTVIKHRLQITPQLTGKKKEAGRRKTGAAIKKSPKADNHEAANIATLK